MQFSNFFAKIKQSSYFSLGILISLILGICIILYRDFIFGSQVFAFSDQGADTINAYIASLDFIQNSISNRTLSFWSFGIDLGANTFGLIKGILGDPFYVFLLLFWGSEFWEGLVYINILKALFSGVFFWFYLKELRLNAGDFGKIKVSQNPQHLILEIIPPLIYALSGYFLLWGQHYSFGTITVYFPLLLWGVERIFSKKSAWLFILALVLLQALNFYFTVVTSIFILLYIVCRVSLSQKPKTHSIKHNVFRFAIYGMIGIGIGLVFTLPELHLISSSERVSLDVSILGFIYTSPNLLSGNEFIYLLVRAIGSVFTTQTEITGDLWKSTYDLPLISTSILSILLLPSVIWEQVQKRRYIIILGIIFLVLTLISPKFTALINGGTAVYYRHSFIYAFALALGTYYGLKHLFESKLNIKHKHILNFINFGIAIGAFWVINWTLIHSKTDFNISTYRNFAFIFFGLYLVWVGLLRYGSVRFYHTATILLLVPIEIILLNSPVINQRITPDTHFFQKYEAFKSSVASTLSTSDEWDRALLETNFGGVYYEVTSLSVPQLSDSSGFSSTSSANYINFLEGMDVSNYRSIGNGNVLRGIGRERPMLLEFIGTNAQITRNSSGQIVLRNTNNAATIAYLATNAISSEEFGKLSAEQKDQILFKAVVDNSSNLATLDPKSDLSNFPNITRLEPLTYSSSQMSFKTQTTTNSTFILTTPRNEGWRVRVNGKRAASKVVNSGLLGVDVPPGENIIELVFWPKYLNIGFSGSLFFLVCGILISKYRIVRKAENAIFKNLN